MFKNGNMKEKATFDENFWKSFSWFLLVVIVICILPWLLAKHAWIDFSSTGEIGDTIGGIMGPFVAIAAAGLTFVAFWVQYKANILQRNDIATERLEAKYYKMLDIYSGITNGVVVHGVKGKEAFAELTGEFTYTFYTIRKIFNDVVCGTDNIEKESNRQKALILELQKDKKKRDEFLVKLAYNLFFYGQHYMVVDIPHPEYTELAEKIKQIGFQYNRTPIHNGRTFADYVKSGYFELDNFYNGFSSSLYEGHSDFLGHYFRHLFQMVKFVASMDDKLVNEETKYGYVKILRSQLSDYEQILLYYNSLTDQGSAWNKKHGDRFPEDAGYIARFRMIKNLPPNFPLFGVLPVNLYKEDSKKWSKLGKEFYEHRYIPLANDK